MSTELPARELLHAALEISKRRAKLLGDLHAAFERGDARAIKLIEYGFADAAGAAARNAASSALIVLDRQ